MFWFARRFLGRIQALDYEVDEIRKEIPKTTKKISLEYIRAKLRKDLEFAEAIGFASGNQNQLSKIAKKAVFNMLDFAVKNNMGWDYFGYTITEECLPIVKRAVFGKISDAERLQAEDRLWNHHGQYVYHGITSVMVFLLEKENVSTLYRYVSKGNSFPRFMYGYYGNIYRRFHRALLCSCISFIEDIYRNNKWPDYCFGEGSDEINKLHTMFVDDFLSMANKN